ncbi:MAG: choice-of-anchor L domain-containing protein [Gemmataceae bacterium]
MSRISIPQCFRRVLSWWRRPRPLRTRQRTFKARPRLEWLEDRTTPSTIYHVDAKALAGGDGLTWASAFTNPQQALTLPTLAPGDEIWVAQGMYSPGANRTDSFNLQTGVGIYGGFAGSETSRGQRDPGANPTVLSGGANSYHVVSVPFGVDSTAVLDGFTVSGGTANGSVWQDQIGAGIWDRGSATFSNLMISSNAAGTGGGMFIDAGSTSALSGITFFENSAADSGGAIYNSAGAPTLTNVTFFRNHALNLMSRGGAVFNDAAAPTFTNVTIYGNDAFSGGGGIYNSNSTPTITNAIIWANLATFGSAQIEDGGTSLSTVNYSDIQGGWAGGVGNTGGDPLLTTLNSYTGPTQTVALLPGSAAIDTGTATGTPGADQRGVGRVGATDMGAFESRGFTITVTGGSGQSTLVGTPFVTPLTVKVASASGEPVKSGKVFFTPPGSGASAALSSGSAVINAAGEAGVTATANAISGTYTVNAQTTGSADVGAFALTNTIDATAFAQALVGTGVTIANAVFTGDSQAIGYFDNSSADVGSQIGIPSGVVMASGSVLNRFGPNTVPDVTTDFQQPGDADLDAQITGYTTYDAAKLEFDFTPNQDTLSFQYVFASDEYNEWANTAYNDVFGFFVDGVDIAVIPGTTTAVSVDNINGGNPFGTPPSSHPELFRNNAANDPPGFIPPYNIQYDGFVTILQAVAHVTPGVSHHIKLAIADAGDHILDSAVFLKGGSFVSGSADLSIAVSDAPDPVGVGQPLVYTITVHNGSSEAASGVIVSDSLPAAIAANPTISASGWSVTLNPDSHVLNAIVDNPLAPGASASFTVTVTPTVPGTLSSFVRLSANEADEGQDDNQVSVSTTVFAGGDATPPTTTATPSAAPNVDGWNSTDVTVTLNATDNPGGSGVQATYYTINGGATQTGTSVTLNSDGKYDIQYWSVDNANNAETPKTLSVWIDKTLPTLTGSFSGTPGANGWYISAGQGALEATDAGSGLAGAIEFTFDGSPPMLYTGPQWIDVEGTHTIVATVSDVAGNVATETFYINIDWTLPTAIPGGPYVAHPGNGVTLSGLASSDNIGVDTYSWLVKGVPLSGATPTLTAAQVNALGLGTFDVSLTVTDLAGNSSAVANTSLSVEETPSLEVTTTDDVVANDGKTSLREAITYANSHPGDDIITFAPGLTGAINLSPAEGGQGALPLTTNVTIDGSGASIILEGGSAKGGIDNIRVMTVNNAVVAYLNNLTIRYGRTWADPSDAWNWSGAGIRNQGALTIANCTFTGNTAAGYGGAIANRFGSLTVSNSTFVDNSTELGQGAALFNDNEVYAGTQMSVTNSTIANNTGAIVSYAPLSVVNCTIVNNTGSLGGIVSHSSVTLTNTLLAQNAAADYWGNPVNAASSNNLIQVESGSGLSDGVGGNIIGVGVTFVGLDPNGLQGHGGPTPTIALLPGSQAINAGTSSSGVVIIPSTDQRGLSRAAGTDIGAFESHGFTIGVTGGDGQTATVNHAFAQALAVKVTANDSLEPVQGGQVTFTAPVGGASAILTGTPATIAADGSASVTAMANGVVGPYAVSAGGAGIATPASFALSNASEGELPSLVVTTTEDVVANDGQTSLREAIAYAETLTGPQIVDATGVAGTINLNSALPALTGEITIAGPGAVSLFVDASHVTGGVSAWSVSSGATITISGLTIQGGVATDGGGIYNSGTLALHSMVITGNRASHFGGGIYNAGSLTIENSLIATNDALSSGQGGGIQNAGAASLTITNSTVTGNRASFYGGGISSGGALTIINATIAANQVTGGYGGGISASQTFTLLNSIVAGNTGGSPDISCGLAIAVNYSLIQSTSGNGNFAPGSSHYITGVSPLLASLANNGGPTQTMALRFGSPAINAGTTGVGVPGVDQRGTTRDATPDMGAYEFVGVASASSTSPDGAYKAGVIVPITVAFTQNVFVAGAPQLTLNDGAVVDYSTGSGTTTLTFNYTVSAGQNTSDLDYLSATALALNGGTIKDSVGNDVTLTLPNPGAPGSLGANKNLIIDTIAPTINAARDGLDYALAHGGWNNFNITASYTASDGGSGLASPATGSQLFSSDGAAQSVTFTVYDLAGNSASATVSDINIDRTAPTLTGDFSGTPGANGWFVSAGMGSLTGGDSLSGVAGVEYSADGIVYLPYTGPVPISDEGAHTVYGRVTDAAGNQTTQSFAVNIDWTPPTTTATLTPGMPDGLHDWYVSDVTIGFFAGDVTSGVARTEYSTDNVTWTTGTSLTLSTDGFHTIWYRSEDVAGNTESAHALDLKIDKTAPTISASAKKADGTPYVSPGWTAQDVTVTFTGDAAGVSGLDSPVGPVTLSARAPARASSEPSPASPVTAAATR